MTLLNRYIFKQILLVTLLTSLILLGIIGISELISIAHRLSDTFTILDLIISAIFTLPNYFNQFLPVVIVISIMSSMGALSKSNELVVMRASGLSVWNLFGKAATAVLFVWIISLFIIQFIVPFTSFEYEFLLSKSRQSTPYLNRGAPVLLKYNSSTIRVHKVMATDLLNGLLIINYDDMGKVESTITAKFARLKKHNNTSQPTNINDDTIWSLQQVTKQILQTSPNDFTGQNFLHLSTTRIHELEMGLPLNQQFFSGISLSVELLSFDELFQQIMFRKQNNLDYSAYDIEMWQRLTRPILLLALVAIIFPLVLGSQRDSGYGKRIFVGIMFGLIIFIINQLIFNIATLYRLPSWLGVGVPMFIYALLGYWRMQKTKF